MKALFSLLLFVAFTAFSQSEPLDRATYDQLIKDLEFADKPYVCPDMEGLVVERKMSRRSELPKKEEIRMLNGRLVAKYKYEERDGRLFSRKLKGKSMTMGTWLTAIFFYDGLGQEVSMVEYKLIKQLSPGSSKVTEKVKVIKNGEASTFSTNSYTMEPPPPPVVHVFEPSTSIRVDRELHLMNSVVTCRDYYHWFNSPYHRLEQRFNLNNQLTDRIFYDKLNRVLGSIRYHYNGGRLFRIELWDSLNRVIREELIIYDANGNVINRQCLP